MTGARSSHNNLPWIFGTLWTLGWICMIAFVGTMAREFRRSGSVRTETSITQPAAGRMQLALDDRDDRFYNLDWFNSDDGHEHGTWPALSANEDTMLLNTIRIKVVRSKDSAYHLFALKRARGNSPMAAEQTAAKIEFPVRQADSIIYLPSGFTFSRENKWRNQQVVVVLEVPVGKMIRIDHMADRYGWFNVTSDMNGFRVSDDIYDGGDDRFDWKTDRWYQMTETGLKQIGHYADDEDGESNDDNGDDDDGNGYRNHRKNLPDSVDIRLNRNDTTIHIKVNAKGNGNASFEVEEKARTEAEGVEEPRSPSVMSRSSISVMDLLKIDG